MNPYIVNAPEMQGQDPQGLNPVFQNANAQQQFMNQQLGQGGQLGQYQSYGSSQGGSGALALANALRNKNPNNPLDQWQTTGSNQYFGNNSNGMGAGEGYSGMNAELGL